jgi:two-component system sensor kinase
MSDLETLIGKDEELKATSIRDMIIDVIENDALYHKHEINIQGDCKPNVDNAMYSVLDNVLRNAILHSGTEKIDINLESNNSLNIIKIIDYGKGIPDNIKDKIFETGFSKSSHEVSLGIGLSIVKNVILRYGGTISVKDTIPSGATFLLKL